MMCVFCASSGQYLQVIPETEEITGKTNQQAKNSDKLVNVQVYSKRKEQENSTLLQVITSEALYKRRNGICEELEILSGFNGYNLYRYRENMILKETHDYDCAIM